MDVKIYLHFQETNVFVVPSQVSVVPEGLGTNIKMNSFAYRNLL